MFYIPYTRYITLIMCSGNKYVLLQIFCCQVPNFLKTLLLVLCHAISFGLPALEFTTELCVTLCSGIRPFLQQEQGQGIIQQFTIPSAPDLVGFFSTEGESAYLPTSDCFPVTHLGGCIIVTKTTVYQCRQM